MKRTPRIEAVMTVYALRKASIFHVTIQFSAGSAHSCIFFVRVYWFEFMIFEFIVTFVTGV